MQKITHFFSLPGKRVGTFLGKALGMLLCAALTYANTVLADIRLPKLVSDGMVLQRDMPVNVWGWADPGEVVTLFMGRNNLQVQTGADGRWRMTLPASPSGGPHTITLQGKNHVVVKDVWFGDVWVASGQSNMELPMSRLAPLFQDELAAVNDPLLRVFTVPQKYNFNSPQTDYSDGSWQKATPEVMREFSGVAYFFAREIRRTQKVAVGIIHASLGGSPAQAWMSEQALQPFSHYLRQREPFREAEYIEVVEAEDRERINAWHADLDRRDAGMKGRAYEWAAPDFDDSQWQTFNVPGAWSSDEHPFNGVVWLRKEFDVPVHLVGKPALLVLGKIIDSDRAFINGVPVGHTGYRYPPRRYPVPPGAIRAGKNVLTVRVVSDSGKGRMVTDKTYELQWPETAIDLGGAWRFRVGAMAEPLAPQTFVRWQPTGLFNAMLAPMVPYGIKGVIWYQGESNVSAAAEYHSLFPALIADWRRAWGQGSFPFIYAQLSSYQQSTPTPEDSAWARLREAQRSSLAVSNTAMVVTTDVGEWNDIHPLDKKTVGERMALAARHLAYGDRRVVHSGPMLQSMSIDGRNAILTFDHARGLTTSDGQAPKHFAIAGADRKFYWANARIRGNRVQLWSDQVPEPVAVRYGWADDPKGANLVNREGLPATPFRTDNW